MTSTDVNADQDARSIGHVIDVLRCPHTRAPLHSDAKALVTQDGSRQYRFNTHGVPLFCEQPDTPDARKQQEHYDRIVDAYTTNLGYPHTQEYMNYLDEALLSAVESEDLGTVAEICCGRGEAFHLLGKDIKRGVGVDISESMLLSALRERPHERIVLVQGDATKLPLADESFDSVFMLGGIHHVNDRAQLFLEVARILRPGGRFIFREPLSDFAPWRALRWIIYRVSPTLDHETEKPLRYQETEPYLTAAGLQLTRWKSYGFLGFCFLMNSDVLVFNRLLRFVPGIRRITRWAARVDDWLVSLPGLKHGGLQVVGIAVRPRGS